MMEKEILLQEGCTIVREPASIVFRGDKYDYVYSYYREKDGDTFTTRELDEVNTAQVYNQYRAKYNIPFVDDIKDMLESYALSASKLGVILGFGENQMSNYLCGEMPSKANGIALGMVRNVDVFALFVEKARERLSDSTYERIKERIETLRETKRNPAFEMIFKKEERSIYNGFAKQSLKKLHDVILYILYNTGDTFTTKLNKLLFYADMLSYREYGTAITGLAYSAQPYGTIPYRYDIIYSVLGIPKKVYYENGKELSPFFSADVPTTTSLDENERLVIETVCKKFRDWKSVEISEANHKEKAWLDYKDTNKPIPFSESFNLSQI